MRGITEGRLGKLLDTFTDYRDRGLIELLIKMYSKELNPWQPIETAPKDRDILIFDADFGMVTANWHNFNGRFCRNVTGHPLPNPTHWMELPEPPK